MIRRHLRPRLLAALADSPVVFLQGARQTGKSTLAQSLVGTDHEADYLTLDDAAVLTAAQRDPQGFIAGLGGPAIIDEVQRVPELFRAIKIAVDRQRQAGRFLLTGSASVRVMPMLSESLVGRAEILTLWPFSQDEIEGTTVGLIDWLFSSEIPKSAELPTDRDDVMRRLIRGGYPEPVQRRTSDRRQAWFGSYVTTILQRDVRDISSIEGLAELPRLLTLLGARTSTLLNASELSRTSGIAHTTLKRYLSLLQATFLLQTVPPWTTNLGKRLVRSPKIMLCDTGLTASLLAVDEMRLQRDPSLSGRLLESFVGMELLKGASWSRIQPTLYHYRSHGRGGEVDLVLEAPDGRIVGIEVKSAVSIRDRDVRGLNELADLAGTRFNRGVLLYGGDRIVPLAHNMHAVPMACLWRDGWT